MLQISELELRKIQLVELELMEEVKRLCELHRIPYVIIAGTLLGSVRHGGCIPWDDDADIAMLREDYERFREVCSKELIGSNYYFQDDVLTEGYRWGYGKFRRADTVFRRENQEHMPYPNGISIDIFPMDGVPDLYLLRVWKNFQCFCIRKLLWSEVGKVAEKKKWKRRIYRRLSGIPEIKVKRIYHRLINKCPKNSKYVRILMFPCPNRTYGYERRFYSERKDYVFEGVTFSGIKDAEGYLRFKFGDYHSYPPVAERIKKQHPVTAIKFPDDDKIREEKTE